MVRKRHSRTAPLESFYTSLTFSAIFTWSVPSAENSELKSISLKQHIENEVLGVMQIILRTFLLWLYLYCSLLMRSPLPVHL